MTDIALIMKSLEFAAGRHRKQFRKGEDKTPYINHPIGVASLLAETGETDAVLISAAILHDVIEDTVENEQEKVELIAGLRGVNPILEKMFDDALLAGRAKYQKKK